MGLAVFLVNGVRQGCSVLLFLLLFLECRKSSDLVFLLDASGSIGSYNFDLMRQWFGAVVDRCSNIYIITSLLHYRSL